MATPEEIAWAAGLFEGEGSVTSCGGQVRLSLKLTDEDVLRRFASIVGRGKIYGPYQYASPDGYRRKAFWFWVCADWVRAGMTFERLAPWLSERRLERARELGIYP